VSAATAPAANPAPAAAATIIATVATVACMCVPAFVRVALVVAPSGVIARSTSFVHPHTHLPVPVPALVHPSPRSFTHPQACTHLSMPTVAFIRLCCCHLWYVPAAAVLVVAAVIALVVAPSVACTHALSALRTYVLAFVLVVGTIIALIVVPSWAWFVSVSNT
jgi:hypothetical protein